MRVSRAQEAENREKLVRAASRLFREKGYDGVGVAEISKQADLTQGALYAQFESKQALAAEAMRFALKEVKPEQGPEEGGASLKRRIERYLSPAHRDGIAHGCPMGAAGSETSRQPKSVSAAYTEGFREMVKAIEGSLSGPDAHRKAIAMVASMIGTLGVARAVRKAAPALSDQILESARAQLIECGLGGNTPR